MSTLKVNTIRHIGASSDAVTLATDGTCTAKITNNLSNRNLVVNGSCIVAQRSTSPVTDDSYRTVDRFALDYSGTDNHPTQAQHALTSSDTGPWEKGFRYSFHVTNGDQTSGAGTGDEMNIDYRFEAQDIANSGWNYTSASSYITLSFWVKASVAQDYKFYLKTEDGTEKGYPMSTGSLSANTWTKITKTIPGHADLQFDNNNAKGLAIEWFPFIGTDKTGSVTDNAWMNYSGSTRVNDMASTWWTTNDSTFELTGLQLEVGDVATDFEHRSYRDELARCKRYYQQYPELAADGYAPYPSGTVAIMDATTAAWPMTFDTMRAAPTVSWTGNHRIIEVNTVRNVSGFTAYHGSASTGWMVITCSGGGMTAGHSGLVGRDNSTTTYMKFSAEL